MYRPTIKSNLWLGLMTIVFIALYYWSDISRVSVKAQKYEERIEAARTVARAMKVLEDYRLPQFEQNAKEVGIADPLIYTMLGEKDSPITTDEGKIEDKITVLNPNFAAAVVDMLTGAGTQAGDTIAVLLTGSMPGANLALYAAAKALKLHPVAITSVGSSWWGANSPDFTWLDMERILLDDTIFSFRSIAASIGGSDDQGGLRLSIQGREMIGSAIDRNEVIFINQGGLRENIDARMELFRRVIPIWSYKAVVNIGGGIAAIGHRQNSRLIPNGVNIRLPAKNYPNLGCVHFFAEAGVPVVQIGDVRQTALDYDLPLGQLPLPEIGSGSLYVQERYNLTIAGVVLALMFIILVVVKYFDHKSYKWQEKEIDSDSIT